MQSRSHLQAMLVALVLAGAIILGGHVYARNVFSARIDSLAGLRFAQKNLGRALQVEALAHPDLVPVYGSSELEIADPYEPSRIFRLYPSGFTVFRIGGLGAESLIYAQRLASAGTALRGKKLVVVIAAGNFYQPEYAADYYAGNFSRLHAYALAFSGATIADLQKRLALRMLDYPDSLKQDPLGRFALERLADGSSAQGLFYDMAWPLGLAQLQILSLQDEWETLNFIVEHPEFDQPVVRRESSLAWGELLANAKRAYHTRSDNNEFGFDNQLWTEFGDQWSRDRGAYSDARFERSMSNSKSWTDLEILLDELHELGAHPLIVCIPLPGRYYEYLGITAQARSKLYAKLEATVARHNLPFTDFKEHDEDMDFSLDPAGHLASPGWVHFAQAVDVFYHQMP